MVDLEAFVSTIPPNLHAPTKQSHRRKPGLLFSIVAVEVGRQRNTGKLCVGAVRQRSCMCPSPWMDTVTKYILAFQ
jgi:hypothetical protein